MSRLLLAVCLGMVMGCGVDPGDQAGSVTSSSDALCTDNGRPMNGRPMNGRPMNGRALTARLVGSTAVNGVLYGMSVNNVAVSPGVRDAEFDAWFNADPAGSDIAWKYVFRCAAPPTSTIRYVSTAGVTYTWPGLLGLAPRWAAASTVIANDATFVNEQERVSGCLMGLTNSRATSVAIASRGMGEAYTATEDTDFPNNEGSFFGNLFLPTPVQYSCFEGNRMNVCSATNTNLNSCNPASGRTCAANAPSCGFVSGGACSAICAAGPGRSWASCTFGGRAWGNIFSTKVKGYCGDGVCDVNEENTADAVLGDGLVVCNYDCRVNLNQNNRPGTKIP
jgi:hypothetical protein